MWADDLQSGRWTWSTVNWMKHLEEHLRSTVLLRPADLDTLDLVSSLVQWSNNLRCDLKDYLWAQIPN